MYDDGAFLIIGIAAWSVLTLIFARLVIICLSDYNKFVREKQYTWLYIDGTQYVRHAKYK